MEAELQNASEELADANEAAESFGTQNGDQLHRQISALEQHVEQLQQKNEDLEQSQNVNAMEEQMAELSADNEVLRSQLEDALAEGKMIYQSIAELEQRRASNSGLSNSGTSTDQDGLKMSDLKHNEEQRFQVCGGLYGCCAEGCMGAVMRDGMVMLYAAAVWLL